jgi:Bifunctional DNA primase/polymerase, N-terminal
MANELLNAALACLSTNQPVIAVGPDKKPYRAGWNKYFSERQTEDEIREQFSNGAYGIARVNFPACLYLALDYDGPHAEQAWSQTGIALPATARITTPSGGFHLVFRQSKKLVEAAILKRNVGIVVANCNCVKNGKPRPCAVDFLINGYEIVPPTPIIKRTPISHSNRLLKFRMQLSS